MAFLLRAAESASFVFELTLSTSASGIVQLYYDPSGGYSWREADSSTLSITNVNQPAVYRLAIPPGRHAFLRFDPLNQPGEAIFTRARIVSYNLWGLRNRVIRNFPASQFRAVNDISGIKTQGDVAQILVVENGHDPILEVSVEPTLVLAEHDGEFLKRAGDVAVAVLLTALLWFCLWRINWTWLARSAIARGDELTATTIVGGGWALTAWFMFFAWSAHIRTLGWNAIELQLAANLSEYGRFALGPLYPTLLWRPELAPILLSPLNRLSVDPVLSFRILTATALAIFTFSMYFCGRRLGGNFLASMAAAITLPLPALSTLLLNHQHSLSHIVMLAVLGPTVAVSLAILDKDATADAASIRLLGICGILWGLSVLARPELILDGAVFLAALVATNWRQGSRWRRAAVPTGVFLLIFLPHQLWVSDEAAKHKLLANQKIYQFYASQGWSVRNPTDAGRDIEAEGYEYATELYGTPESNDFSIARAIWRSPRAFADRVDENFRRLQAAMGSDDFFSPLLRLLIVSAPIVWALALATGNRARTRTFLWAAASFGSVAVFLALHIDARYLTIAVPFAIVLALYSVQGLALLIGNRRDRVVFASSLLVAAALIPGGIRRVVNTIPKNRLNLEPVQELAGQFVAITQPTDAERAQMYVAFGFDRPTRANEDVFMFWYFTRTTMALGRPSDSTYPRNRLYSYRACSPTHGIVRPGAPPIPGAKVLGDIHVPELGDYQVVKLSDAAVCQP